MNGTSRQDHINELKSKVHYAETSHAALYESNPIYIEMLNQELNDLERRQTADAKRIKGAGESTFFCLI